MGKIFNFFNHLSSKSVLFTPFSTVYDDTDSIRLLSRFEILRSRQHRAISINRHTTAPHKLKSLTTSKLNRIPPPFAKNFPARFNSLKTAREQNETVRRERAPKKTGTWLAPSLALGAPITPPSQFPSHCRRGSPIHSPPLPPDTIIRFLFRPSPRASLSIRGRRRAGVACWIAGLLCRGLSTPPREHCSTRLPRDSLGLWVFRADFLSRERFVGREYICFSCNLFVLCFVRWDVQLFCEMSIPY